MLEKYKHNNIVAITQECFYMCLTMDRFIFLMLKIEMVCANIYEEKYKKLLFSGGKEADPNCFIENYGTQLIRFQKTREHCYEWSYVLQFLYVIAHIVL